MNAMSQVERLPILPLRALVLLPGMRLTLVIGRPGSLQTIHEAEEHGGRLVALTQKDPALEMPGAGDLFQVGTVAQVLEATARPDGKVEVLVEGRQRCRLVGQSAGAGGRIELVSESGLSAEAALSDVQSVLELAARWARQQEPPFTGVIPSSVECPDVGTLADRLAAVLPLAWADRQAALEVLESRERLLFLGEIFSRDLAMQDLKQEAQRRVRANGEKSRREHLLREQLKLIQEELGERDGKGIEIAELRQLVAAQCLPDPVRQKAEAEIRRLERMPPMAAEVSLIRNYLDLILDLPWNLRTTDRLDLQAAQELLDAHHYGLTDVKERILEYIAVRQVKARARGLILCLNGPPGVGKTSLAASLAAALGRKFVRIALGGVRDEAEIRGHRRVYVGAQPGRIIQGIRAAGSSNPVILLDELDKMMADFHGDPAAALLEVLDPEQNGAFRDNFLEIPFDLGDLIFVATVNDLSRLPPQLRDRMEIIRIPAYTEEEKCAIASRYLWPRQLDEHGLDTALVQIEEATFRTIIREYTREAGVRELDRKIAQLCRRVLRRLLTESAATLRIEPVDVPTYLGAAKSVSTCLPTEPLVGVSLGLAVSEGGGGVIPFEVAAVPGDGELCLTGGIGELMRDSAQAAFSWIQVNAPALGLEADFSRHWNVHLHMPGGAPKNGTSGGVPTLVAMLSALTGRPVRCDVAMTGEVTLRGRVLPVGGIRDKVLAAAQQGVRQVLIPEANREELTRLPAGVRDAIEIRCVTTVWEVVEAVLLTEPALALA